MVGADSASGSVGLAYAEYLVVAFRVNATGEPGSAHRHERRMSVFFKQDEFTFYHVLCDLEPVAEITLTDSLS